MKKMVLITFLFSTVIRLSSFAQNEAADLRFKDVDLFIDSVLQEFRIAGCAVAVVEKGKIIYSKGFGLRDYENKIPVTANTVFPIASCTKAFTASLIGILSSEGKIDIDKPIRNYLPDFRFYDDYTTAHATTRDLLVHRTGVPRHDRLVDFFDKELPRDSLLYKIRFLMPSAELRQRAQYNNLMYVALGGVSEKLTNKSWEQNIKEKILNPLEMTNTSFHVSDLENNTDHSWGYYRKGDKILRGKHEFPDVSAPAGGINSSVNDMAKWLMLWLDGGLYKGKQIIPADFVRQAKTPQMVNGNANYGLGWQITSFRGAYNSGGYLKIDHGGDLPFYSSNVSFYPYMDSIGIVVLTNQFGGYGTNAISAHIADLLLNGKQKDFKPTDWLSAYINVYKSNNTPETSMEGEKNKTLLPLSHPLKDYAGKYYNPAYGTIEILLQNDILAGRFNKLPLKLNHSEFDIFDSNPAGRLQFLMNNKGNIVSIAMPLEESVKDIVFVKR